MIYLVSFWCVTDVTSLFRLIKLWTIILVIVSGCRVRILRKLFLGQFICQIKVFGISFSPFLYLLYKISWTLALALSQRPLTLIWLWILQGLLYWLLSVWRLYFRNTILVWDLTDWRWIIVIVVKEVFLWRLGEVLRWVLFVVLRSHCPFIETDYSTAVSIPV